MSGFVLLSLYIFSSKWRYFSKKYGVDQPRQKKNISLSSDASVNPLVQEVVSKGRTFLSNLKVLLWALAAFEFIKVFLNF